MNTLLQTIFTANGIVPAISVDDRAYQFHVADAKDMGLPPLTREEWFAAQKFVQQKAAQARLK